MSNANETKPTELVEPTYFGMTLGAIVTLFLGALLGIVGTMFTNWWTSKEPHLTKRVSEILPFQGEKGETGILNLTLSNDGSKESEEIEGRIRVEGSSIEDVKVTPEILGAVKAIKGDTIEVKIKTMNAGETLQVAALVKKNAGLPSKPVAEFRAKGVIAVDQPLIDEKSSMYIFMTTIVLMTTGVVFGGLTVYSIRKLIYAQKYAYLMEHQATLLKVEVQELAHKVESLHNKS